ncbi:hypothetical protein H6G17_14315 [Chroococcidiopsis sp. FACHB-1243]|uniref:hypothetical protein n=1 Tax=Chroococcidiopsis sp. [FACHB-1243] TaxID=2692781 RepID=UPI0017823EE9|nr:hypothetical protein [Chroococcidiopsis sp. [FACHB-1243]]MBD2306683.1 hypothetical protein [Chroococcidiopsis sp. [FACHB-1243]]
MIEKISAWVGCVTPARNAPKTESDALRDRANVSYVDFKIKYEFDIKIPTLVSVD